MSTESIHPIFTLKRKRTNNENGSDDFVPEPDMAAPTTKTAKTTKKPRASAAAMAAGTCSLTKKEFGDRIKAALRIEKYDVQRMRIDVSTYRV
ncbi:hypothetical protein MIND_00165700 [Mycena indigotica]|uniref:Uncharacterized protein n=1 Tax=Mycena indigotica TaxID=2126181 RepID=A0A8H6TGW3_9AGAR|nr:uncharacterized protein MIND_00165700 [Mycena indigotica]KAF7316466.1 hypothetical protein MIND_00165700 [Mycena indigotica]